jgi:flagellin
MIINHNLPALRAFGNYARVNQALTRSMERLSSGLRINRAADDPAGLAISESMRAQIKGLNQATRNAQDAISLLQTAEGALDSTHAILDRMRELAVKAASGTYTANDRLEMQKEIDELAKEIDQIGNTTTFNNLHLLDGSAAVGSSTDKATTQVFARGGLEAKRNTAFAGGYQLEIDAAAGLGQIQRSSIFRSKGDPTSIAALDTRLADIDRFTDANGKFLLDQPQTLTLIAGDGQKATVQISASDTIGDLVDKLNRAVGDTGSGLGQAALTGAANADKFVSFVTAPSASGPEATGGTLVIRSAVAGGNGAIQFVGSESLLNALGLSEVQRATANRYTVTVRDAANPAQVLARNVTIEGNMLAGVIDPNIDVRFDSNADILTTWDAVNQQFRWSAAGDSYRTSVNLAGNPLVFQIGAGEGQVMGVAIGDMRAAALGVDHLVVTDRQSASKAITALDHAIDSVSSERSGLGAAQNRLEHTINNLTVMAENLTAAESRIRDVDMAAEMLEYTKLNVLSQVIQAMMVQANQLPQMVLRLLQE